MNPGTRVIFSSGTAATGRRAVLSVPFPTSSSQETASLSYRRNYLRNRQQRNGRVGDVAGGVGGENFDDVVAEFAVEDAFPAGTEHDIGQNAVDINVVANVDRVIKIVG